MKKFFYILVFYLLTSFAGAQTWEWAKASNNNFNASYSKSTATDVNGNVYLTGNFTYSIAFGTHTLNTGDFAANCVFIVKYDSLGNVIWARNSNGPGYVNCISSDLQGNVFITGHFGNMPFSFGAYTVSNSGNSNAYLFKFDSNGNALWGKNSSGIYSTFGNACTVDGQGNSYITGNYNSPTVNFDSFMLSNPGGPTHTPVFIVKYDPIGNVIWVKNGISSGSNGGTAISDDKNGNIYCSGFYASPSLVIGTTTLNTSSTNPENFLIKLDASGNVIWARSVKVPINSVCVDGYNDVYITGNYNGVEIFNTDTLNNPALHAKLYYAKFNSTGTALWGKSAKNKKFSGGNSICADSNSIYIGGYFADTLIVSTGSVASVQGGDESVFVMRGDLNGNADHIASAFSGGAVYSLGNRMCIDKHSNMYVAGTLYSPSTNTFSFGTNTITSSFIYNSYISKFSMPGPLYAGSMKFIKKDLNCFYPNPAKGVVYINIDPFSEWKICELVNLSGQTISSYHIKEGRNTISIELLKPGLYTMVLSNNFNRSSPYKLVVE